MNRNFIRVGTVTLFLLLSIYFVNYPVFKDSPLSEYEGEALPIYFAKVIGKSEEGYNIVQGTGTEEIGVITDAKLENGDIVSFYGIVKNNRLILQKHHLHENPETTIYLSVIGLFSFLLLMKRRDHSA